ncbi:ABC transporter substrate-binding protein [Jatrophihabitans sp.]|uniref:ABC transporter substrate-binding protein n=1 Tax=Jatrophihabitans sp. TaxID=1932789 RepID=UPI0030C6AFA2|nr:hypothetical protein [Jatrophihabitans sp.]
MSRRLTRKRAAISVALVACASMALAACSSSGGSSGGSGSTAPAGTSSSTSSSSATTSGSDIKIMVIGSFQSAAQSYPEVASGAEAAADSINAAGGVAGHKIKIIECNDQNDPNVSASCGRSAVSDKVVAVTSGVSNYSNQFLPVLQASGIPDIGDTIYQAIDLTSPVAFPFDGGSFSQFAAVGQSLASNGCKKVGVVRVDAPVTEAQAKLVFLGAKAENAASGPDLAVAPTLPSFAATVQTEINAGADCLASILPNANVDALIAAVKQSAKPDIRIGTAISTLPTTDLAKLNGSADNDIVVSPAYPVTTPQAAPFLADMKKYEPKATVSAFAVNSWAAIEAFATVGKTLTTFSASSVLDAFNKASNVTVPMYPAPFNFAKPNPVKSLARIINTSVLAFKIKGTSYEPLAQSTVDTAAVLKAYAG